MRLLEANCLIYLRAGQLQSQGSSLGTFAELPSLLRGNRGSPGSLPV